MKKIIALCFTFLLILVMLPINSKASNWLPSDYFYEGVLRFTGTHWLAYLILQGPSDCYDTFIPVKKGNNYYTEYVNYEDIKEIVIDPGVTHIKGNAFANSYVTSVSLSNTLEEIGASAFLNSEFLETINFPESLKRIGASAFSNCVQLSGDVTFHNPIHLGISAFSHTAISSVHLPDGSSIEEACFKNCESLSSVSLPADLTYLAPKLFENCISLNSITLPDSLASIGDYCFKNTNLSAVFIPESVSHIGNYAFYDSGIHSLRLPKDCSLGSRIINEGPAYTIYGYRSSYAENYAREHNNTFVPLDDCNISIKIKEQDIKQREIFCGTVMNEDTSSTEDGFSVPLTISVQKSTFTDIHVKMVLPNGFSFDPDNLVTEKTLLIESVHYAGNSDTTEHKEDSTTIYPIYVEGSNDDFMVDLQLTAIDSLTGNTYEHSATEIFMTVTNRKNHVTTSETSLNNPTFEWSEAALGSGNSYDQDTAQLCAILSALVYNKEELYSFLRQLGCYSIESAGVHSANIKDVGRYYAYKRIIEDGEIRTLTYIICRGTASLGEALGDLQVGKKQEHIGFSVSAQTIMKELKQKATTNSKYVVTGHSKGAAAANLVGHYLNTGTEFASQEDISVYTFATPTVDSALVFPDAGLAGHENIFNFVNYQDIIRNAASMAYFGRWGTTILFNLSDAPSAGWYHDGYSSSLAVQGLKKRDYYTINELLNGLMYSIDASKLNSIAILAQITHATNTLAYYYDNISQEDILKSVTDAHSMAVYYRAVMQNATSDSYAQILKKTLDAQKVFSKLSKKVSEMQQIRVALIKCPVDVYVENENGETVAYITRETYESKDGSVLVMRDADNLKIVMIPETFLNHYTISVIGYDDGVIQHANVLWSEDSMKVSLRSNIPISKGELLAFNENGHITLDGESAKKAAKQYQNYKDDIDTAYEKMFEPETETPSSPAVIFIIVLLTLLLLVLAFKLFKSHKN